MRRARQRCRTYPTLPARLPLSLPTRLPATSSSRRKVGHPIWEGRRGTASGLLGLSRNIGLISGASLMGAVFAYGAGTEDFIHATPAAISAGMQLTFLLAGALMIGALAVVFAGASERTSARAQ